MDFEYDEELTGDERAFADALRIRAANWTGGYQAISFIGPEGTSPLIAAVDIIAAQDRVLLLVVGVHLNGRSLRGDRLHSQLYTLPDEPTDLVLTATGSPVELAAQAADWFESILRRPIVRYDWTHDGQVHACTYLFSDTGRKLVGRRNRQLAPPGQLKLGPPDVITQIRGERA